MPLKYWLHRQPPIRPASMRRTIPTSLMWARVGVRAFRPQHRVAATAPPPKVTATPTTSRSRGRPRFPLWTSSGPAERCDECLCPEISAWSTRGKGQRRLGPLLAQLQRKRTRFSLPQLAASEYLLRNELRLTPTSNGRPRRQYFPAPTGSRSGCHPNRRIRLPHYNLVGMWTFAIVELDLYRHRTQDPLAGIPGGQTTVSKTNADKRGVHLPGNRLQHLHLQSALWFPDRNLLQAQHGCNLHLRQHSNHGQSSAG